VAAFAWSDSFVSSTFLFNAFAPHHDRNLHFRVAADLDQPAASCHRGRLTPSCTRRFLLASPASHPISVVRDLSAIPRFPQVCVSQALPAIVAVFAARLEQQLALIAEFRAGKIHPGGAHLGDDSRGHGSVPLADRSGIFCPVIEVWRKVGFLVGWQSLLSTYGKEEAMLGDAADAVAAIGRRGLVFVLTPQDGGGGVNGGGGGMGGSGAQGGVGRGAGGGNCNGGGGDGGYDGAAPSAAGAAVPAGDEPAVSFRSLRHGSCAEIVVELAVAPHLWAGVPHELRQPAGLRGHGDHVCSGGGGGGGARGGGDRGVAWSCCSGSAIRCVVVLLSQGIDAQQSMASVHHRNKETQP